LRTYLRSSIRRNKELFHDKSISHDKIIKLHELDSDVGAEILAKYESASSPKQHLAAEPALRLSLTGGDIVGYALREDGAERLA
jgi:hypothetical protein